MVPKVGLAFSTTSISHAQPLDESGSMLSEADVVSCHQNAQKRHCRLEDIERDWVKATRILSSTSVHLVDERHRCRLEDIQCKSWVSEVEQMLPMIRKCEETYKNYLNAAREYHVADQVARLSQQALDVQKARCQLEADEVMKRAQRYQDHLEKVDISGDDTAFLPDVVVQTLQRKVEEATKKYDELKRLKEVEIRLKEQRRRTLKEIQESLSDEEWEPTIRIRSGVLKSSQMPKVAQEQVSRTGCTEKHDSFEEARSSTSERRVRRRVN